MERSENRRELPAANDFDIKKYMSCLKKTWWVTALLTVSFAVLSFIFFSVTYVPMYRSNVRFTITPLISSDSSSGNSVYKFNYNATLATQMAATFPYIINSGVMSDIIANEIGRPVSGRVTSNAVADTNIFEIDVTSRSADDAYDIINSVMLNYPKIAEYVIGDTRMNVIEGSEPELATEPYNTGYYYKYVVLFALAGMASGLLINYFYMKSKKTVMSRHDIEETLGGRCVCSIPDVQKKRSSSTLPLTSSTTTVAGFSESMRLLRQRTVSIMRADNAKIIGVTSTGEGEGKTTVAYNLARSLSGAGKTLLVDMDLAKRTIQAQLNRRSEVPNTGITEAATGSCGVSEVINSLTDTFDILFAGSEDIRYRRSQFEPVFETLRNDYDYIVVDLPASGRSADAVSVADLCDEVLFVVRWNGPEIDEISAAVKFMEFSRVKLAGYVLNGIAPGSGEYGSHRYYGGSRYGYGYSYGYGYGYGYGHKQRQAPKDEKSKPDR